MFIRDPWTTETEQQAGSWNALGAVPGASDQALLRELHGLALSIYQAKRDIQAAETRRDVAYIAQRSGDLRTLATLFGNTVRQFRGNDTETLTAFDNIVLGVGMYLDRVANAFPGAVARIPNLFLDALAIVARKAGGVVLGAAVPVILLGLGAIWLVMQAERTRTGRALARRV